MSGSCVWPTDREPYHGDIVQGQLGNCFLISTIQSIASCQPQLLKSIIADSPLRCFFYRQGQRVEIPVELVTNENDHPYCRSTVNNIQWPYIIEQAYAQFYGGRFENLAGGNTSEAFYDLLGRPVEDIDPNENDIWNKMSEGLRDRTMLVTCGSVVPNGTIQPTNGLRINHAYAILTTFVEKSTRERFVLIHNPHGTNHLNQENQRARQTFFSTNPIYQSLWANTLGTQLISWNELKRSCNRVQVCHLNVESQQVLSGNWSSITSGGCSNFSTFHRNPLILLPENFSKRFLIVLGHTTDQRTVRTASDTKLNYPQLGVTLVRLKSHSIATHDNYEVLTQSKFWNKRETTLDVELELRQGEKCAIVFSNYFPNFVDRFWIEVFSQERLPTVELSSWIHPHQQSIEGEWNRNNAGGRMTKSSLSSFYRNPAYRFHVSTTGNVHFILHPSYDRFVSLSDHHPIGINILSSKTTNEATFIRARSVSKLIQLNADEEYYIVPSCYAAGSMGKYHLDVLCDVPFTLDPTERKPPIPPSPTLEQNVKTIASPRRSPSSSQTKTIVRTVTLSPTRKLPIPTPRSTASSNQRRQAVPVRKPVTLPAARSGSLTNEYTELT